MIATCVVWFGAGWHMCFIWPAWYLKLFFLSVVNFQKLGKLGNFTYKYSFHTLLGNLKDLAALALPLLMTRVMWCPVTARPLGWFSLWFDRVPCSHLMWLLPFAAVWAQHSAKRDQITVCSWSRGYRDRRGVDVFWGAPEKASGVNHPSLADSLQWM